ncbi:MULTISPECIES: histidine phosphatase family protein [Dethiosulfovibrio]|uniref:Histidine phosphatase family protein n=2 Tax=Dethiosulfovibrio TaxID=47054 RepID=A0ABS9EKM5_9BACT|nr:MULTISPECIES: histidine phosphatase family protein [Dethiosulfovibrio]MCF4113882.1 histidine phosphatase family protein [Dethiosulfovibrio russensis]MCF4141705.1 histidine phosphatase family protein [Dethiosulfovibrio marinus]MCF4143878.1 histidine phosphatase family protein [Dethiosulfovibrio acidaminovorans]MEA3284058.1 histidine phosphatase family protein [Synergistota bacterium]
MDHEKTTLILVRHGECDGNKEGMFRGNKDFPLNSRGMRQADEVGRALANLTIDRIYSSPLLRAKQTAHAIAGKVGLSVVECPEINNISLGRWEGRRKDEIAEEEPELWSLWLNAPEKLNFPGMEPLTNVMKRSREKLDSLVELHRGKTIALVSHRTVLKPLVSSCIGIGDPWFWKLHFDTASISVMVHDGRGYSLTALNRTDHLSDYESEWN